MFPNHQYRILVTYLHNAMCQLSAPCRSHLRSIINRLHRLMHTSHPPCSAFTSHLRLRTNVLNPHRSITINLPLLEFSSPVLDYADAKSPSLSS